MVVTPDIFGTVPLTQQGCDLLASPGFYVPFPDLLGDQALTEKDIPGLAALRETFFAGFGNPMRHVLLLTKLAESVRADGFSVIPSIIHAFMRVTEHVQVGSIGYCWGAKITILVGATRLYSAVALVHPS
ncbi:hypothetical protein FS749_000662 [Ceratobasidium sp. UAMH 11750]|nr:hypothetical protein FS749_000662 [Ceratobasidium sp. UAMH 11750]